MVEAFPAGRRGPIVPLQYRKSRRALELGVVIRFAFFFYYPHPIHLCLFGMYIAFTTRGTITLRPFSCRQPPADNLHARYQTTKH
jgi:hypothetical protein